MDDTGKESKDTSILFIYTYIIIFCNTDDTKKEYKYICILFNYAYLNIILIFCNMDDTNRELKAIKEVVPYLEYDKCKQNMT